MTIATKTLKEEENDAFSKFFYFIYRNGGTKVTYPEHMDKKCERVMINHMELRGWKSDDVDPEKSVYGEATAKRFQEELQYVAFFHKGLKKLYDGTEYPTEGKWYEEAKRKINAAWLASGHTIIPEE